MDKLIITRSTTVGDIVDQLGCMFPELSFKYRCDVAGCLITRICY